MDPDEALRMIRLASHELAKVSDDETLDLLLNHFRALDEWLSKGGFLPRPWQAKTDPPRLHEGESIREGMRRVWADRPLRDDDYTPAAMDATDQPHPFDSPAAMKAAGLFVDRPEPLGPPDPAGVPLPERELEPDVEDSSVCCPDCGDTLAVMVREVDHRRGATWTGDGEIVVGSSNDVQTEEIELFCHQGHGHFRVPDVADYR